MLLLRYESRWARSVDEPDDKTNKLATIFNSIHIGGEVANYLFEQGWKSVFNAASSSSSSWRAIANSIVSRPSQVVARVADSSTSIRKSGTFTHQT